MKNTCKDTDISVYYSHKNRYKGVHSVLKKKQDYKLLENYIELRYPIFKNLNIAEVTTLAENSYQIAKHLIGTGGDRGGAQSDIVALFAAASGFELPLHSPARSIKNTLRNELREAWCTNNIGLISRKVCDFERSATNFKLDLRNINFSIENLDDIYYQNEDDEELNDELNDEQEAMRLAFYEFGKTEFQLKIGNQTRKHSTKKIEKYETPSLFEIDYQEKIA